MELNAARLLAPLSGLVVGAVLLTIQVSQGVPPSRAAIGFGIVVAWSVGLWVLQPRSDVVRTIAGRPVDERWRLIHLRAMEAAAVVTALFLLAGFAVTEARGGDSSGYALGCVVLAVSYIGAVVWYRRAL